jgi:hypothetical protein
MAGVSLTLPNGALWAFTSVQKETIGASAVLTAQNLPPSVFHTGLARVSPVTKYAVFKGTATGGYGISSMSVNYAFDDNMNFSTATVKANGQLNYNFLIRVKLNFINASKIRYRINATGVNGLTGTWPFDGSFFEVSVTQGISRNIGVKGGKLVLYEGNPDDDGTSVEFPAGALDGPCDVSITELDPADTSIPPGNYPAITKLPVSVYRFEPSGSIFNKPVKLSLLYPDSDRDGIVDDTAFGDNTLKVMWWDGFEWRVVGTSIDSKLSMASGYTKHFSLYAVFPVSALTDEDYRPKEKIITPATVDGSNDFAIFGAIGPGDTINIFDVNGRRVKQLKNDNTMWDGKDENGNVVESGLYVYQIKVPGKIVNGTIVVAK